MLNAIVGSKGAERVLLYLQNYGEGYARSIAETYGMSPSEVQKQLRKFENGGYLVCRPIGKALVYSWKPGNPLVKDLRRFLQTSLDYLPESEKQSYYRQRRRPRRAGKPM